MFKKKVQETKHRYFIRKILRKKITFISFLVTSLFFIKVWWHAATLFTYFYILHRKYIQYFIYNTRRVPLLISSTKYVHIKSTTVYAPRRNWDSPNPFLASECSPPPRNRGEGATSLRVGGWGESQFRRGAYTVVLFICTYFVISSLYPLRRGPLLGFELGPAIQQADALLSEPRFSFSKCRTIFLFFLFVRDKSKHFFT
jgi:hypothetical protein